MKQRYIITLSLAIFAIFGSQSLFAQTCRVSTGKTSRGCKEYKDVYEYDYVDVKPEFPGGGSSMMDFINSKREYPQEAYKNGVEGRVTCSFVVNPDGKISNVKVLKGVEQSLNNEALRIISMMPDWTPGSLDGVRVPVRVIYCIPFRR